MLHSTLVFIHKDNNLDISIIFFNNAKLLIRAIVNKSVKTFYTAKQIDTFTLIQPGKVHTKTSCRNAS